VNLEFSIAQQEDLGKIVQTYNAAIPAQMATADLEPVSILSKQTWFEAHSANKRPLWLVQHSGNYAGWLSFNSFYGRPAYDGTAEISIYLENAYQGKGIGKACLAKAIAEAPSLDVHTLLGFIFSHNHASLNLFYAFGFDTWAKLPRVANMQGVMRDLHIVGLKTKHPLNVNT
jgi:phosphinothricin acetyltransferase